MKLPVVIVAGVVAVAAVKLALGAADSPVPYPEGYRAWRHVKTMLIEQGHPLYASFGGIHHLYANEKALHGYRTGEFADGAVIAFDLLEATAANNAIVEGKRKVLGVMHRDARRYGATGGWGFEGFVGGSKTERAVAGNAATACFGCHVAQQKNAYVFSSYRE